MKFIYLFILIFLTSCGGGENENTKRENVNNITDLPNVKSDINLKINASRLTGVAPLSVFFDSIGTIDESNPSNKTFHNLNYIWEFEDVSTVTDWKYGGRIINNKKNIAYGPVAGHVFENSGIWKVKLTAITKNKIKETKTITITVDDPSSLKTICVSNMSLPIAGEDDCPNGADTINTTSWTSLSNLTKTHKRILLKRGESWSVDNHLSINTLNSNSLEGGIISSYGISSIKPKIILTNNSSAFYLNKTSDWKIINLEIMGNGVQGSSKTGININSSSKIMISNLIISDIFIGIGSSLVDGLTVTESHIYGMYDGSQGHGGIAMYLENTDNLSILGSKFVDSPATHIVRIQGSEKAVISNNLFELAGPTRNALTIRGKTTTTTLVNGFVPWSNLWTEKILVSNNIIDNSARGGYALYVGPQSVNHAERLKDIIVENNYIKSKDLYAASFQVANNLTVRNNIFTSYYSYTLGFGLGGNAAGSPESNGVDVYNNTIFKPDTSKTTSFSSFSFSDAGKASNVKVSNNIVYGFGNIRNGAGNGNKATLMEQNGITGIDGINYFFSENTDINHIATVKPWSTIMPIESNDFSPTTNYGVQNKVSTIEGLYDFSMKEVLSTRIRGAIDSTLN